MAAVSLFWDTSMAAVTSCENTLLNLKSPVGTSQSICISVYSARRLDQKSCNVQRIIEIKGFTIFVGARLL